MSKQRASQYNPFLKMCGFDIDSKGNIYLKVGKKVCLNAACTMYVTSTATGIDFYNLGVKRGQLDAGGWTSL